MQITTLLQPGETLHYVTDGELDPHLPKPPPRLLPERPSGPSSRSSVLVVAVLLVINAFETVFDLLLDAVKWPSLAAALDEQTVSRRTPPAR